MEKCDWCGAPIDRGSVYYISDDQTYWVCGHCATQGGTCATCAFAKNCAFETDPSPLPKMVQRTIRNGNTTMNTVVVNPERVRITCEKGCKCFDQINGCLRENNCCASYKVFKDGKKEG